LPSFTTLRDLRLPLPHRSPNRRNPRLRMEKVKLVLVPGLLCDARLWSAQIENLSDIAEMWVADHTRSATMADVARDVLRDAPFEKFALAGLSMGGYISLEIMRQAPQRVLKLALLDTAARGESPEQSKSRYELIELAERGGLSSVSDALMPLAIHPSRLSEKWLTDSIRSMFMNTGKAAFIRQLQAIMSRSESRPILAMIGCPTLVLCGRQDQLTPLDRHVEMAAGINGAVLGVLDDCGHMSTMEKPAEVNRALRHWLAA
jgi:pimeloyl-ACP methyl ester carboxylesterase